MPLSIIHYSLLYYCLVSAGLPGLRVSSGGVQRAYPSVLPDYPEGFDPEIAAVLEQLSAMTGDERYAALIYRRRIDAYLQTR